MNRSLQIVSSSLIALFSLSAFAQKPALVQNVDEKGRVPFQQEVLVSCSNIYHCLVELNVPTGQRLVLTDVNARVNTYPSPASAPEAELRSGQALPSPATSPSSGATVLSQISYGVPVTSIAEGEYLVKSRVTYFVDGGSAIGFFVQTAGGTPLNASNMGVTFVGYLIPIPASASN